MKIILAESALADLEEIVAYYRERGVPDRGREIVADLLRHIEQLERYPDSGRVVPEFDAVFLRELIRPPFRVVYRRDPARIRVVRVCRSERLLDLDD